MTKSYILPIITVMLLFSILSLKLNAQISQGGTPLSFDLKKIDQNYETIILPKLDLKKIAVEDIQDGKNGSFRKIGKGIAVDFNMQNSGTWSDLPDGRRIWRLKIKSEGALALGVYYSKFILPAGSTFFLYNENKRQVIGAFNETNSTDQEFATELTQGESVTLEYLEPLKSKSNNSKSILAQINISEVSHVYRDITFYFGEKDFGDSETCEVNVNCPEGDNYQNQKRGVARIYLKEGSSYGWCTGSLVNNTNNDGTPYFLTADHCGGSTVTASDLNQWVFYFLYQSSTCSNPASQPASKTVVGAVKKAVGPISGGSDFFLIQLNSAVPASYTPYYNGWTTSTTASTAGAGIHHPAGDIKKISTYTTTLTSASPNIGGAQTATNSEWQVAWTQTTTNQGVTEGGSSGSPLFNTSGYIVGTLSGGSSYCTSPTDPDFYGKFSYHWTSNGTTAATQLKPWLDPTNSGVTTLAGYDPANTTLNANFTANNTTIIVNSSVVFTNSSTGTPTSYSWNFGSGASPATATGIGPHTVTYTSTGTKTVTLTISNGTTTDTETKTNYITVNTQGNISQFSLDFEACTDFTTSFTPWTVNDVDQLLTYGIQNISFTHSGEAMAFIAFNPTTCNPTQTNPAPHGGSRFGACFAGVPASPIVANNDWLISPKIQLGTNSSVSFWVKAFSATYEERFKVGVSNSTNAPSNFTTISTGTYEVAPNAAWTQKTYSLNSYNNQQIYLGINCVSVDAFLFMIDDINFQTTISINDIDLNSQVAVYPNPSFNDVFVDLGKLDIKDANISVYDICGKAIKIDNTIVSNSQVIFNFSNIPNGIYFIEINTLKGKTTKKVSIMKQ